MDASRFVIRADSPLPIYRQIVEQLRRLIAGGQLVNGDLLPSVRAVATFHGINPMTVSRAYALAETDGLLKRLRGKGMAVTTKLRAARGENQRLALLDPQMQELARHVRELELDTDTVLRRLGRLLK